MTVVGELCITLGVLLFAFLTWQLWWTDVVANRDQAAQVQSIENQFAAPTTPTTKPTGKPKPANLGDAFALVRIPRFGSTYVRPVHEGTSADILDKGIGHYAGTAQPGQVGNFATAGHRTTYGKPYADIANLRVGDKIVVETRAAYDVYVVTDHEIVLPTQVDVIYAVPGKPGVKPTTAIMTMTSCNPKFSAAQRYIVHAKLAHTYTRAQGLPAGTLSPPKGG
jgi:sortase A